MQLTQKQESLISRHLRDMASQFDASVPEGNRNSRLRSLQSRIYNELDGLSKPAISDEDVLAVLDRLTPEAMGENAPTNGNRKTRPAPTNRPSPGERPPNESDEVAPVWLGVCAFNAERFGAAPWMVRLGAFLLGLVTGPLALLCYLGGYAELYFTTEKDERDPIDYGQLAIRAISPLAAAIGLRWLAYKLLALVDYGYEKAFSEPVPPLGKWDWLAHYDGTFFFLLWTSVIPLGILSGLPLANAWGHSIKRLAQALVALYFMTLCFGIAMVLVGLILDRVQPYMQ